MSIHNFHFVPLAERHLSLLYHWFQEPIVKKWYAQNLDFTFDDIKNKYLPRIQGIDNTFSYIIKLNNDSIGFIQYYALSHHLPSGIIYLDNPIFKITLPEKVCGLDILIVEDDMRGKGLGVDLINQFIYEMLVGKFNYVVVDPTTDNANAICCYEKCGFKITSFSETIDHIIMIREITA